MKNRLTFLFMLVALLVLVAVGHAHAAPVTHDLPDWMRPGFLIVETIDGTHP